MSTLDWGRVARGSTVECDINLPAGTFMYKVDTNPRVYSGFDFTVRRAPAAAVGPRGRWAQLAAMLVWHACARSAMLGACTPSFASLAGG
jgi:hypothetical protein